MPRYVVVNNHLVATVFICALLLTACSSERSPEQVAPSAVDPYHLLSKGGTYAIEWKTIPAPIPLNNYFEMDVLVSQPLKSLNHDVKLEVNAGMLAHDHGMYTKPIVEKLKRGHFRVRGMLFHMAGEWQITFRVARGELIDSAGVSVRI